MNICTMMYQNSEYRKGIEKLALLSICSCLYYDLADYMCITDDAELLNIINDSYGCDCDDCLLTQSPKI